MTRHLRRVLLVAGLALTVVLSWASVRIAHQSWARNTLLITGPWLLLLLLTQLRTSAREVRRRFRDRPYSRSGKR
ncbi:MULTISPECIES: hypothetical protein [Kitasatospora]|uniref:Uncharacterized protein n=1 Tax=Kitasatospora cystarginea TaxID=58350 RepID=A0ABN3E5Z4_9ACTN